MNEVKENKQKKKKNENVKVKRKNLFCFRKLKNTILPTGLFVKSRFLWFYNPDMIMGLAYLFNGISTPYGLSNAEICVIYKLL